MVIDRGGNIMHEPRNDWATDDRTDEILERAYQLGCEHGRNAASWYFDGNTPLEAYRATLEGIRDGDPAVYDTFPSCPLSGEWADGYSIGDLLHDVQLGQESDLVDDVCRQYEDGFDVAVSQSIERTALYQLEGNGE